jgi:hypothetical protein
MGKMNHAEEEMKLSGNERRFLDFLKKGGYLSDPEVENPEVRAKKRADNRRIYHNTQLMLEHYRDLVWAMESIPNDLKDELDVPLADLDILISRLDMELSLNNRRLESRIDALIKSRALVDRLNEAISFLRTKPGEGELLYQIIYHTYIGKKPENFYEVIDKVGLSKSRYYTLRKRAITMIGVKLWSVPDEKLELWLELLSYFEQ